MSSVLRLLWEAAQLARTGIGQSGLGGSEYGQGGHAEAKFATGILEGFVDPDRSLEGAAEFPGFVTAGYTSLGTRPVCWK